MKNQKLNLGKLKVQSFVTDLEKDNSETIKGGVGFLSIFGCNSCGGTCNVCSNNGCTRELCPPPNTNEPTCVDPV